MHEPISSEVKLEHSWFLRASPQGKFPLQSVSLTLPPKNTISVVNKPHSPTTLHVELNYLSLKQSSIGLLMKQHSLAMTHNKNEKRTPCSSTQESFFAQITNPPLRKSASYIQKNKSIIGIPSHYATQQINNLSGFSQVKNEFMFLKILQNQILETQKVKQTLQSHSNCSLCWLVKLHHCNTTKK